MSRSAPLSEGVEQLILEIDDHVASRSSYPNSTSPSWAADMAAR
jgi:hypothetical protein